MNKVIVYLLLFCLLFLTLSEGIGNRAIAAEASTPIVYKFTHLGFPDQPTQEGWSLVGERTTYPVVGYQYYGSAIGTEAVSMYREFLFDVPATGIYLIDFKGFLATQGAIAEIQINGNAIGTYDFYGAPAGDGPTVSLRYVHLEQGTHTLKLLTVGKHPDSGQYRMTPSQFIVKPVAAVPPIDSVDFEPLEDNPVVGDSLQLAVLGVANDGIKAELQGAVIHYSSNNPAIADVNETTGELTAIGAGTAVITAFVNWNGSEYTAQLPVTVTPYVHEPIVYKFTHLGFPDRPTQEGWSLVGERTTYPVLGYQYYGSSIGTEAVGMYREFLFNVPETGTYLIDFKGFLATQGAIAEIQIDDRAIGTYDFYGGVVGFGPTVTLRYVHLEKGTHTLKLLTVGKHPDSGQYRMTPSEFIVKHVAAAPPIVSAGLDPLHHDLMVGESIQIAVHGLTDDAQLTDLPEADIRFSSANPAVAEVDESSGMLTAAGAGSTTITAVVNWNESQYTAQMPVTIKPYVHEPIVYKFNHLGFPGQPTQEGWSLVGERTTYPVVGYQYYGSSIGTENVGMYREFLFDVPATGMYLIKFRGLLATQGAIAELQVDDKAIGTYDFYGAIVGNGPTNSLRYVYLEQGTHVLKLLTIDRHPDSGQYRMTPMEFFVEHVASVPELQEIEFSEVPELYVGSHYSLYASGILSDNLKSDLPGAEIDYISDNESVVTIDDAGIITATGEGTATITADVTWNGENKMVQLEVSVVEVTNAKTRRTIYTQDKVDAARHNIAHYAWAAEVKDEAVAKAEAYLAMGLDFLWELVPPQSLPRSYSVNETLGSPVTGKEIDQYGNYPYVIDPLNDPWKITDPSSGYRFPTNDFGAFYRSGLDEHGIFNPDQADRSLLVNTLYPEKGPTWGVDDGNGWIDEDGNYYTFIAYYIHWGLWANSTGGAPQGTIPKALDAFRDAYLYTGDIKYARAGIVLLDRVADIYPDLDTLPFNLNIYQNAHGFTRLGKATGSIWESQLIKHFLYAYDAFFDAMDDPELLNYLSGKSEEYDLGPFKLSADGIRRNIEEGIVKQIYPAIQSSRIRGNPGFHQSALALAAVVYDSFPETKEWLDFNHQSGGLMTNPYRVTGGNIGSIMIDDVDRDGNGNEASPLYNSLWLSNFLELANIMDGYDLYPEGDLYQSVKFRNMFFGIYPWLQIEAYTPQVGDTGNAGRPIVYMSMPEMIKAFEHYQDPVHAQLIHFLNGFTTEGLHGDIFTGNPEQISIDIEAVIDEYGPINLPSMNMTGTGFAALRDGLGKGYDRDTLRNVWMYYGLNDAHGHRDTLQIGLHAFGLDLTPDLGYPETTQSDDTHNYQWIRNTISHNTVVVDNAKQEIQWIGTPKYFDDGEYVKLIDVEAPDPYPQTDLYRRTTAMIQVDDLNSYAVDFFRVKGGQDHHFSFHAAEGTVSVEGLELTPQQDEKGQYIGSYAGLDVGYGQRPEDDSVHGSKYMGPGFHYLRNVDRDDAPEEQFSVDWDIVDTWGVHETPRDIHLRLTMLGQVDEVALADGSPSQRAPGNPEHLRYMIAHRSGANLDSLFTSVIEPYESERFIHSILPVVVKADGIEVTGNEVRAVKVELLNGRTDYLISALDPSILYTIDDRIQFKGAFGVYSEIIGQPAGVYVMEGSLIGPVKDPIIDSATSKVTGTIVDFTRDLSMENSLIVEMNLQGIHAESLIGRFIYADNDGERNAVYEIMGVEALGNDQYVIDIGGKTLIRRYVDANDFSQGYVYDVATGGMFRIPLSYEVSYTPDITIESIQQLVESYDEAGAFANDQTVRTLTIHLTSLRVFVQQDNKDKVVQHMQGFETLLEHQKNQALISLDAYRGLKIAVHLFLLP